MIPRSKTLIVSTLGLVALQARASAGDECVVRLKPATSVNPLASSTGSVVLSSMPATQTYLLAPASPLPPSELADWLAAIAADETVLFAEMNKEGDLDDGEPCPPPQNDFQCTIGFVDGDHHSSEYTAQPWYEHLNVPAAQSAAPDLEVVVAVIDTGVDTSHSAFAGKLAGAGYDFLLDQAGGLDVANGVDDDGDGAVDEAFGHGTAVAGAVVLINPMARVLALRVADAEGKTNAWAVSEAIEYAISEGAAVINLSLSFDSEPQVVAWAAHHAVAEGISVITSAGNTGGAVLFPGNLSAKARTSPRVPGIYPHGVVAVAAVDNDDVLAVFSAFGEQVDLSTAGVTIYSAYPGEQWATWSGTSMASGVASGIASLVQACEPTETSAIELMLQTAVSIDDANPGFEGLLGWGVPDALAAVLAALE